MFKNDAESTLLDKKAVAALLLTSVRQVDYLRKNENLPWISVGNQIRFRRNKIEEWLDAKERNGNQNHEELSYEKEGAT